MTNIKVELESGTIILKNADIPIKNLEYTTEDDTIFQHPAGHIIELDKGIKSVGFEAKVAMDNYIRFIHCMSGIVDTMMEYCPNKRVVYLAQHHKSPRVRKKNYKRMIRIVEKEGEWLKNVTE